MYEGDNIGGGGRYVSVFVEDKSRLNVVKEKLKRCMKKGWFFLSLKYCK